MTYVKRLSDYALAGGSGRGRHVGNKLTKDPTTGALLSIGPGGSVSGRVSGPRQGDLVGFKGFGDEKGVTYRTTGELKGANKKYIAGLQRDRQKLEDMWAKARANEAAADKQALNDYEAVMKQFPKDGTPDEMQAFMERPEVRAATGQLKGRMVRSMKDRRGLDPATYAEMYKYKPGDRGPGQAPLKTYQRTTAPKPEKSEVSGNRRVLKMQDARSGANIEVRSISKDGQTVKVQDVNTRRVYYLPRAAVTERGKRKFESGMPDVIG